MSLCGIGGTNKLVKEVKAKKPNAPLILCLDNDEPGEKATQSLTADLKKLKVPFIAYNVSGKKKDPNELLMDDPKKLQSAVTAAKKEVRKIYKRGVGSISASDLSEMHIEPPPMVNTEYSSAGLGDFMCQLESWQELDVNADVLGDNERQRFFGLSYKESRMSVPCA